MAGSRHQSDQAHDPGQAQGHPFRHLIALTAVLILVLLSGCAGLQAPDACPARVSLEAQRDFAVDRAYQKCLYSPLDRTVYLMDSAGGQITLWRDGTRINTIGGVGFDNSAFLRLSDIALSPDGKLLALDSFRKVIKKFDSEGKYVSSIAVDFVQEPTLLAVTGLENFYLYDRNRRELASFSSGNDPFFFGKFMVDSPTTLECIRDQVWTYDARTDKTLFFTAEGRFDHEVEGRVSVNAACVELRMRPNWIEQPGDPAPLSSSVNPIRSLHLGPDFLAVLTGDRLALWKIHVQTP
jgi:hypothetical protein